jgi:putative heme-binding domain-containing protein
MSRLIRPVISFGVALLVVAAVALATSLIYSPMTIVEISVDVANGRSVFIQRCASCHAVDERRTTGMAPNLARIGAVAAERVPGMSAEAYLLESILRPDAYRPKDQNRVMPANVTEGLDRRRVINLVAYLMTLGGELNYKRLANLPDRFEVAKREETADIIFTDVEAGKRLYMNKAKCITCHPLKLWPAYNLHAPSLLQAGRHDRAYLIESIYEPSKVITPGYETWIVELSSGETYSGRLLRQGPDSIDILTGTSEGIQSITIQRGEIARDEHGAPLFRQSKLSTMPSGFEIFLSKSEVEQIVAFLKTLNLSMEPWWWW